MNSSEPCPETSKPSNPKYSPEIVEPRLSNGLRSRKRKLSDENGTTKKIKLSDNEYSLCMFSEDVLLIILSHLQHGSLFRARDTCTLFSRLCEDYTLWRTVNFVDFPATAKDLEDIGNLVNRETKLIHVRGKEYVESDEFVKTVTREWLHKISKNCPQLESLALPYHFIDCQLISISDFPLSITTLDLSHSRLRNLPIGRSYFKDISLTIPNLKSLILSNCDWFEPHSLMAISKCINLEELRLNDCIHVRDCLAYCGLSTRGGFKKLKTLDLRRCMITTSELACFSSVTSLKNLLLENVDEDGLYSATFIDPAIIVLCTKTNEMDVDGDYRDVDKPYLLLENLTVRHFQTLSDRTLASLARDARTLKYLDITGTGVTIFGVKCFKKMRPSVTLIHDAEA